VYDVIGVLDWNIAPIVPGRGSAIFLHAATPDYAPTAGCVALALNDLLACLEAGLSRIMVQG
jgi:L,D-peptidoglycan transpeptidase YkuD (ErfK/YbiS/YcfS/YnhG family)